MADATGVYISYRAADGTLVSSSRDTVEEVLADLPGLHKILVEFNGSGNVVPLTLQGATENVEAMFAETSSQSPPDMRHNAIEAQQFEACSVCGGPKNVWKSPGVGRNTGKPYPGFFACPTWHK